MNIFISLKKKFFTITFDPFNMSLQNKSIIFFKKYIYIIKSYLPQTFGTSNTSTKTIFDPFLIRFVNMGNGYEHDSNALIQLLD